MAVRILKGDCRDVLRTLPDESVHCVVTSPPYFGLRDYGVDGQIGLEADPEQFVEQMLVVFTEARRVLRSDGTFWLNLGDGYAASGRGGNPEDSAHQKQGTNRGSRQFFQKAIVDSGEIGRKWIKPPAGYKQKDLIGIPWMTAFALRDSGWYLRSEIIWAKPNSMPGSQEDRCTSSHETIFMFSKSRIYYSEFDAIKTPPRESSLVRTAQDTQAQAGSHRANGGAKTNGTMKAVGVNAKPDKQRGHGRKHAGFNDRWDAMKRDEQQARPAMMRDVWFVPPATYSGAHFAVMPEEIARRCILAGSPEGGTVLDPFGGAGTTALVADRYGRSAISIELNPDYADMQQRRLNADGGLFADVQLAANALAAESEAHGTVPCTVEAQKPI